MQRFKNLFISKYEWLCQIFSGRLLASPVAQQNKKKTARKKCKPFVNILFSRIHPNRKNVPFQIRTIDSMWSFIKPCKILIITWLTIYTILADYGYSQGTKVAPGYIGLFDHKLSEKGNPYVFNEADKGVEIEPIFPGIFYCNPESNGDATFSQLSKNPHVQELQPNFLVQMRGDPLFHEQWQYMNDGRAGGKVDADMDAPEIWDLLTAQGHFLEDTPVVAVLDVGFSLGHEDWQKNQWLNHAEVPQNGVDDDLNGFIDDYQGWRRK